MSFEIRPVRKGDEEILAYIQTESWKAAFSSILPPDVLARCTELEKAINMYRRLLDNNVGNGFLLSVDGQPHGIAWWDAVRGEDIPDCAELICIHSLPNRWRQGYGSELMDYVLTDIFQAGYKDVLLWVFAENHRARAFYDSFGFTATDRTKDGFGAKEICYIRHLGKR